MTKKMMIYVATWRNRRQIHQHCQLPHKSINLVICQTSYTKE